MIRKIDRDFYLFHSDGRRFRLGKLGFITDKDRVTKIHIFISHVKKPERHYYVKGRGYPLNLELLHSLKAGGVNLVMIPEEGKTGFRCYSGTVDQYLCGEMVCDGMEEQRCVPLDDLKQLDVDHDTLVGYLTM